MLQATASTERFWEEEPEEEIKRKVQDAKIKFHKDRQLQVKHLPRNVSEEVSKPVVAIINMIFFFLATSLSRVPEWDSTCRVVRPRRLNRRQAVGAAGRVYCVRKLWIPEIEPGNALGRRFCPSARRCASGRLTLGAVASALSRIRVIVFKDDYRP